MRLVKRIGLIMAICLPSIGCDQATKAMAVEHLPRGEMLSFFNDVLRIGYAENTGAFLGLGHNLPPEVRFWLLVVVVGVFLAGLAGYLLVSARHAAPIVAISLLFSGGLSNFYDRVVNNGAVVDFINIGVGSLRTGIFNVADVAIMAGLAILLFSQRRSQEGA